MHVINVDIQDNHEEATLGAFLICELCQCVSVHLLKPACDVHVNAELFTSGMDGRVGGDHFVYPKRGMFMFMPEGYLTLSRGNLSMFSFRSSTRTTWRMKSTS